MGEKEQGLTTARGMDTDVAQTGPEGGGIAIDEEGVQATGGGPAARATNLNSSRSNVYRTESGRPEADHAASEAPIPGKPTKDQRMKAGLDTAGGALASGAARTSHEGDSGDAARISTNVTIEEPKQRHFGG